MKKQISIPALLLVLTAFLMQSCLQDACDATRTFVRFDPVYKQAVEIRKDVTSESPRTLKNPGKIYYYNQYMFINEIKEGVHIIDNSDPASPQNIAFLNIPGNVDIAVKGNTMYADNYMDVLVLDISSPTQPRTLDRQKDVLLNNFPFDEVRGYVVDYTETDVTEEIDCNDPRFGQPNFWRGEVLFSSQVDVATDFRGNTNSGASNIPAGVGGSFARFAIYKDFLYIVDNNKMDVFDIGVAEKLDRLNTVQIGWGIETIFPYQDKLFIGSNSGLFIYDNSSPQLPTFVSQFTHARACDPVVVEGTTAYVTLRGGTICEGFNNQLDILDISNIFSPRLIATHEMDEPHGLAVRDEIVYLCDGESGLKVFDANNPKDLKSLDKKKFDTYDAIALRNSDVVMVIGADGFYQFDASSPKNLKLLSVIPVEN